MKDVFNRDIDKKEELVNRIIWSLFGLKKSLIIIQLSISSFHRSTETKLKIMDLRLIKGV